MTVDHATRTEFLRYIYAQGGASEAARQTDISEWREAALDAMRDGGVITSTSSNAASTGFSIPTGWTPQNVMALASWARGYVSESSIDSALADVPARVTRSQTSITNLRVMG